MIAAPIRRLTVEEYHTLAEVGVLHEDDRVELINGQLIDMLPIGPFHSGSTKRLLRLFERSSRDRWITSIQDPVALGPHDEPQPDLMLLRPEPDFYSTRHPGAADVFLLVEISDSTLIVDRQEKLPLYARSGIPEVWIVNLPEHVIEVYRQPAPSGSYSEQQKVHPGESLAPAAFPDAVIDTAALLKVPPR